MASKAIMTNNDDRPDKKFIVGVFGQWNELTRFLSDVRAEMRKVVAPGRKEVQSTTIVVIITVFIFGIFFLVVDTIFQYGLHALLGRLGGF